MTKKHKSASEEQDSGLLSKKEKKAKTDAERAKEYRKRKKDAEELDSGSLAKGKKKAKTGSERIKGHREKMSVSDKKDSNAKDKVRMALNRKNMLSSEKKVSNAKDRDRMAENRRNMSQSAKKQLKAKNKDQVISWRSNRDNKEKERKRQQLDRARGRLQGRRLKARSRHLLYDHDRMPLLLYHYVGGFSESETDWKTMEAKLELQINEHKKKLRDHHLSSQRERYSKQKQKYSLNRCKMCDAKYLDTEKDTQGNYHTCCYALKGKMQRRTQRHAVIQHPDENIQKCDLLRRLSNRTRTMISKSLDIETV